MASKKILNLGCGQKKMRGAINVDFNKSVKPDVTHDLNSFPYPFKKGSFDVIYCLHLLEHLDDIFKVMKEIHRISKKGARVIIRSPHFSHRNAYQDPSHKHYFSISSFDYFSASDRWAFYTNTKFKIIDKQIFFQGGVFRFLLEKIFNKHYKFYESKITWILPAEYIEVILEPIK